jgi:hypothetical protein
MFRSELKRTSVCAVALLAIPLGAAAQTVNLPRVVERDVARELSCAAQSPLIEPIMTTRILAGNETGRTLFARGDAVIINAGAGQGIQTGQQYYVRRLVSDRFSEPLPGFVPLSVHTAGWLRIVDTQNDVSIGTITQACDGIMPGDYLEPFVPVPVPVSADRPGGEPDYSHPAHLILADERRQIGSAGSLMVMDRGTDHGLRAGQHLTIFRNTLAGAGPIVRIGSATVAVVGTETSLVRIETSNQAVFVGDLLAIHR